MNFFSFNPTKDLTEEGKWLLAVTCFQKNSVFFITDKNNSFSFTIPSHWFPEVSEETVDKVNEILELRSQRIIEIPVEQTRKKG